MNRIIMHIDVNNAFLSWSAVYLLKTGFKTDIRNRCAIIAGDKEKRAGIVLAKSTPAKKLGVKTAEPIFMARKKCPKLEVYPPNYKFYSFMSNKLFEYLKNYSPDIEIASIDECYLDYTKVKNLYGDAFNFAKKIQIEIYDKFGFTVNIGIANNKLCAKMASDFEKPNKIHTLYDEEVKNKMWPLAIEDLFGIGKQTSLKLRELGIKTIGNLANYNPSVLRKIFKSQASKMIEAANGIDNTEVNSLVVLNKGISNEITLTFDTKANEDIFKALLYLSESVGRRIRKMNKYASTICVIIKNDNFIRKNHQKKLINPVNSTEEIYDLSKEVYLEMKNKDPIRLIGIRLDNLKDKKILQTSLFDDVNKRSNSKLDSTIDELKDKFGSKIIKKASLLDTDDQRKQ